MSFLYGGCTLFQNVPSIPAPEMILVEGGTFMMGDVIEQKNEDALPLHLVELNDFYIGKYEVTYAQYDAFAVYTKSPLPEDNNHGRGDRAVARVSWHDALSYCNFFELRLPTENEWEYAAREGGRNLLYSGTSNPDSLKYFAISEVSYSFYVGSKQANALGIHDMSGNVSEWIGNYYQFYEKPEEWHDIKNSSVRIIRGGSFSGSNISHVTAKSFWRVGVLSDAKYYDIGFRCAKSAES
ncbi:MAG: SUMF1/EgtB/PvdO family nonheme iron enzyme [Balneolaceae bacterium]